MKYLTGIKPTGVPHYGNFISTINPIIENYNKEDDYYLMIADSHSLTTQIKPEKLREYTKEVILFFSSILKDEKNIMIYRQSQIPEIFELSWILSCFTAKGLLNRNHTYKSLVEENRIKNKDDDKGIFMGLFNYPVLMCADILLFQPDIVTIGKDQEQNMEICLDIAKKMNYFYKTDLFKIPKYTIDKNITLNSYDGRKMSKSYNNTIPLFCNENKLRKYIFKYKTNNKIIGEEKYFDETELSNLIKYMCPEYMSEYLNILEIGMSWKDIKEFTFNIINDKLLKYRENYEHNKQNYDKIQDFIKMNEYRIKKESWTELNRIKKIIGLI